MCQINTFARANFENRAVDSARAKRWTSSQISPANWARAKMATAMRGKIGLAIRADAAHQRRSRASMLPTKTRTNHIIKDRTKEAKSSERGVTRAGSRGERTATEVVASKGKAPMR